jgi:hypothetical protein
VWCPEGFAPDVHGPRRAARREPFGTVANAAGGRGRKSLKWFCGVFGQRRLFNGLFSFPKNPAISGRKNGVLFSGEEALRQIRFFCPKSHTGTAEGVQSQPFALART